MLTFYLILRSKQRVFIFFRSYFKTRFKIVRIFPTTSIFLLQTNLLLHNPLILLRRIFSTLPLMSSQLFYVANIKNRWKYLRYQYQLCTQIVSGPETK